MPMRFDVPKLNVATVSMSETALKAQQQFNDFVKETGGMTSIRCLICGGNKFIPLSKLDRYGFAYKNSICRSCGNVQVSQYYSNSQLDFFYRYIYRDIYSSKQANASENYVGQFEVKGPRVFNMVKSHLGGKRVLEVGCGAAGILGFFKSLGFDVEGIDLGGEYLEYAKSKGIRVHNADIEEFFSEDKYDLIIMSHVLEHITNPSNIIKKLKSFLKKDGVFYIEVPSLESVSDGWYDYDLNRYLQNAHVVQFNIQTLTALMEKFGLSAVSINRDIASVWKCDVGKKVHQTSDFDSWDYSVQVLQDIENKRYGYVGIFFRGKDLVLRILKIFNLDLIAKKIFRKIVPIKKMK